MFPCVDVSTASYKGSLSLKLDRHTNRPKSRSRSPERRSGAGQQRGLDKDGRRVDREEVYANAQAYRRERDREAVERSDVYASGPSRSAAEDQKAQYLKSRYGDSSAR